MKKDKHKIIAKILAKKLSKTGFSLVEILAAIAILLIGVLSLIALFSRGMDTAGLTKKLTLAILLAQQKMEDVKRENHIWSVSTTASGEFPLHREFRWRITVTPAGGNEWFVKLTVHWTHRGQEREYELISKI